LNVKRGKALETAYGCAGGEKLWRDEPQERIRHETRPGSSGRMKAPRGCENLKAQAARLAGPAKQGRCSEWGDAEGEETSREALQNDARFRPDVEPLGNRRLYAAARCLGYL